MIHCLADCRFFLQVVCPPQKKNWFENNRKISITKEICMTIDFAPPPEKIPGRKPDFEAGCIFENFTPKQGNSLKLLTAGTGNHGVSLPPSLRACLHIFFQNTVQYLLLPSDLRSKINSLKKDTYYVILLPAVQLIRATAIFRSLNDHLHEKPSFSINSEILSAVI